MDNGQSFGTGNSRGYINGFIGVLIFSGSLPATKAAVHDFTPFFVTVARATIAGLVALCMLLVFKEKRPTRKHIFPLVIVASGVVLGFPLLTALALQYVTSAHSIVFIGMLPLTTAIFGVIRGGERPRPAFWLFSISGSLLVIGFAIAQGLSASPVGDILMLLAIILCGLGYAERAKLSKALGGWQVISWALVLSLPFMTLLTFLSLPSSFNRIGAPAWMGLSYVSLFSMLISRVSSGRYCSRGSITTAATIFWLGSGRCFASRTGEHWYVRCHCRCCSLCCRFKTFFKIKLGKNPIF